MGGIPARHDSSEWYRDLAVLEAAARRTLATAHTPDIPGYDGLLEIARGGQGVVFRGVQRSTRRAVAVKLLNAGAETGSAAIRRFQREVDAVASLRHPGIVQVYDSGARPDGRPYLVMEYVTGQPLEEWLARVRSDEATPTRRILVLFAAIADALHYAHQRGVLHRDLKPGNIRVSGADEPRLLDFGVARLTEDSDGDARRTRITQEGQFVGSLAWASPEQISGKGADIDVRSDVYSLGVTLFHALTGQFPYDVSGGLRATVENIASAAPQRPSAMLRTADDDLDTILLTALAKRADARYQSAADLAADLRRYLAGEPLAARRESAWKTLRRTVRRYRWLAAGSLTALLAISAALVVALVFWTQATHARDAASAEAAKARKTVELLQRILASPDPQNMGKEARVADLLEDASRQLAEFEADPLTLSDLHRAIGLTYIEIGLLDDGERHSVQAVELAQQAGDAGVDSRLRALGNLALLRSLQGRWPESEALFREVLAARRALSGDEHPDTLLAAANLVATLSQSEKGDEAQQLAESTQAAAERVMGATSDVALRMLSALGTLHHHRGNLPAAEQLLRQAHERQVEASGAESPAALASANNLAYVLTSQGKLREAANIQEQVLAISRRVKGEDHPETIRSITNLAGGYSAIGDLAAAEALFAEALPRCRARFGDAHPDTLLLINNLGKLRVDQNRPDEAAALLEPALPDARQALGEEHEMTLRIKSNLAKALQLLGRLADAETMYRELRDAALRVHGPTHLNTVLFINNLGDVVLEQGGAAEARALFNEGLATAEAHLGAEHWMTANLHRNLGRALTQLGRFEEAERHLLLGYDGVRAALGENNPRTHKTAANLVELYSAWGKAEQAAAWHERAAAPQ